MMMMRGRQLEEQGKTERGRALQRTASEQLRQFYKQKLPLYRRLSGGGR
jgi:hypothetical protein